MTSHEIRKQFLDFFENKEHRIVHSSPVVPFDDPTLLFTNAGMNQFKDVFLGKGKRDYKRAADTQKCIRVSGKHNDLEEVGHDTYHHTFFEMLGNWSFGDYYKEEAIIWAWELLTEVWKLPKERLWATVYRTDDEAFDIWKNKTDINPNHILRFDEKDNFWEMGETGPCGPCSEIHFNRSDNLEDASLVNAGKPECVEIWNLVFIQYNRDQSAKLTELPAKHVDTGMGFERICSVLQAKDGWNFSNYDADVFQPLIQFISKLSGVKYDTEENQIPMRVIADHIRTLTFAIADGAVPGNDGRGYVLRRILRRASRYGRKLNFKEPFLYKLVDALVKTMGDVFPEIQTNQKNVEKIIKAEEESFNVTLDRGIQLFEEIIQRDEVKKKKIISGEDVFKLYDTFGFPPDLTNVMATEKKLHLDKAGFNKLMDEQKERARKSTKDKLSSLNIAEKLSLISGKIDSKFEGYDHLQTESKILDVEEGFLILDRTPFYAESGGQVGDTGILVSGEEKISIVNTIKHNNVIIHEYDGNVNASSGETILAKVDSPRRWDIMRNHSATHFLHSALRKILGTHVKQAGSYVGPDRLRFDFTHFQKVSNEELREIESLINYKLHESIELMHHRSIPFEEAKKMGALMFFGDKYGDKVNVVQFSDFSLEFCGGTHVKNSSQIGLLKIVNESSIASGIRRIEAVTGLGVEKYIYSQLESFQENHRKIEELLEAKKKLEKELAELKLKENLQALPKILSEAEQEENIFYYKGKVSAETMDELKSFGDELRLKMKDGIGLLAAEIEGKVGLVCVVSDSLIKEKKLSAGKIVGDAAKLLDGGGGGRPHLATAGAKDIAIIDLPLKQLKEIVKKYLG